MQNNQVEEVKGKTDIVSLISEYIEVKKAGRNYKANCPFHGEKTPSFMISPELQMYKCFGCGKSGDVFTFLEEHEGMEFGEALKYLAEKAGIKLTSFKTDESSEKEKITEINKSVLNFYEYILLSHPQGKKVLEYLTKERGLSMESIKMFKLGYSPDDFQALPKYLQDKKKFSLNDLSKAGLLVGRGIDRFKGRVMFPLFDHRGIIIGFAGRILPWAKQDMAKYINSPETPTYHKSKVLYGLDLTKSEIREKKFAVIVEGELDMISSYQAGIKNVIAIKGSALTEDQIRLIGRFAQKIVLCLDSDFAGDEAARRGAILAENLGFEVKVAHLEGYKDPDEIAKKDPASYKKAIEEGVGIWDFLINQTFKKFDSGTGEGKAKISKDIIPLISSIQDGIVRAYYIEMVARKLSVPVEAVYEQIQKFSLTKDKITPERTIYNRENKPRRQLLEEKLLANSLTNEPSILFDKEIKDLFSIKFILKIIDLVEDNIKKKGEFNLSDFSNSLPKELSSVFAEIIMENPDEDDKDNIIKELKILDIKDKMEALGENIREAEVKDEAQKINDYQKKYSELAKKLSTLE